MQIPFAGPDLEHLFHRLFTAFKVFTEFFKGYSVLLFEELTQFEEDHGCVFRLRDNDSDTGSGDITFLQQVSIRGRNFLLPEEKPCTSPDNRMLTNTSQKREVWGCSAKVAA